MVVFTLPLLMAAAIASGGGAAAPDANGQVVADACGGEVMPEDFVKLPKAVQEQKLSCFTREAVKRFNRTLPSKVDKTTVLQSVSAEGVTMTYHYRVDVDRADIKPAALEAFKGTVRGKVCAAQDMHTIIRVGGKYRYLWLDKNGKLIGSMIVDRC